MAQDGMTRRELLQRAGVWAAVTCAAGFESNAWGQQRVAAPAAPVALAHCDSYALPQVTEHLRTLLDQIGGIGRLVTGKTVAVKVTDWP